MYGDFSVYLFDLDGVLWTGSKAIPMAAEVIQELRCRGKHIRFVSNTSGADVERLLRKFARMGIEAYRHELFLASFESANYVAERKPGGLVYLIGYESLYQELMRVGMQVYHAVERQPKKADFLLVGNDSQIGIDKFTCALRVLQNGAEFVAVNQDPTVPSSDGFTPGTGALVGAISTMIGRKPDVCIGKPSPLLLHRAVADLDVYPWECIMIGDTLESDIVAGRSFGAYTVLVSTGNANRVCCSAAASMVPDKVVNSLEEIL